MKSSSLHVSARGELQHSSSNDPGQADGKLVESDCRKGARLEGEGIV